MRQPSTHRRAHPAWKDAWNPYRQRETISHLLDKNTFNKLLEGWDEGRGVDPDLFTAGGLDAPDEIPLGSTSSVFTIGCFYREHYSRLGRDLTDLASYEKAEKAVASELRRILSDDVGCW